MKHASPQPSYGIVRNKLAVGFAVTLLMSAGCGSDEGPDATLETLAMKQISVEGIDIRYVDQGQGDPIVLVHGIPTSSYLWRQMIDELSTFGRVIAPDLPGFGLSDPPTDGKYTISRYADLLASFLAAIAIDRGTPIFHDFGGPVTVTYALRNPEKYERLIILDTFLHTNDLAPYPAVW